MRRAFENNSLRGTTVRWLSVVAVMGTLAGCGGGMRPTQEGPAAGSDPGSLLQILASTGSPEVSRVQADQALAGKGAAIETSRAAVLRKIVNDPREADTMRTYALQTLADTDPEACIEMLQQDLPQLQPLGIRQAACAVCEKLNDLRLINPLIRALANGLSPPINTAPEVAVLEALGHGPLEQVLTDVIINGRDLDERLAAAGIMERTDVKLLRDVVTGARPDAFMGDLQWSLMMFDHVPTDGQSYRWASQLRAPVWQSIVDAAAARNAILRHKYQYTFSLRAVGPLATLPLPTLQAPSADLMRRCDGAGIKWPPVFNLRSASEVGPAGKVSGLPLDDAGLEDRVDVAVIVTLAENLASSGLFDSWRSAALAVANQRLPCVGGLIEWKNGLQAQTYPTMEPDLDTRYTPTPQMLRDYMGALAAYVVYFDTPVAGGGRPQAQVQGSIEQNRSNAYLEIHVSGSGVISLFYHSPTRVIAQWQPLNAHPSDAPSR
jgi:hypothetical protein